MFFIPSGFSDFCCFLVASEGGLHRMWCVHHGGSPGFHHVIPGVCTLSSLGSWETFGKPTVSLAPSGLENQMSYRQKGLCKGYVLEWNIGQNLQKRR